MTGDRSEGPSIRRLQCSLPWSVRYSRDFRANPQSHKDFAHALAHVVKAAGKLAAFVDDLDHRRESEDERVHDWLADLIICAVRMANTHPGATIDLEDAVLARVAAKNP